MSATLAFLARHGGLFFVGTTTLLALGAICLALHRAAIDRRRVAELTVTAVLVWLVLACVPLPRVAIDNLWPRHQAAAEFAAATFTPEHFQPSYFDTAGVAPAEEAFEEFLAPLPPAKAWPLEEAPAVTSDVEQADVEPLVVETTPPPLFVDAAPEPPGAQVSLATPKSPTVPATIDVARLLAMAYLVGAAGALVWLALGRLLLWRIVLSAAAPEPWLAELYAALPRANRRRPARLITSARSHRPLSFGLWRPTIVLPAALCRADQAEALRHVLLHEQAHVEQRDAAGGLLLNVAMPLLYFHPLYWSIRSQAQMAAELIADDRAAGGTDRTTYAEALVAVARRCGGGWPLPVGATGVFDSHTQFYRRMEMLLKRKTSLATHCSPARRAAHVVAFVAVVSLLAGAAGVEPVGAQEEKETEVEKKEVEVIIIKKLAGDARETEERFLVQRQREEMEQAERQFRARREELERYRRELEQQREEMERRREEMEREIDRMREELERARGEVERGRPKYIAPRAASPEIAQLRQQKEMVEARLFDLKRKGRDEKQIAAVEQALAVYQLRLEAAEAKERDRQRLVYPGPPATAPMATDAFPPGERARRAARRWPQDSMPRLTAPPARRYLSGREGNPFAPTPTPPRPGVPRGLGALGASHLDLLPLATAYPEAAGQLEIARVELARTERLAKTQNITGTALLEKKLQVRTLDRQVKVLRIMLEGLVREADFERSTVAKQIEEMSGNKEDRSRRTDLERRLIQIETRIRILREIGAE